MSFESPAAELSPSGRFPLWDTGAAIFSAFPLPCAHAALRHVRNVTNVKNAVTFRIKAAVGEICVNHSFDLQTNGEIFRKQD